MLALDIWRQLSLSCRRHIDSIDCIDHLDSTQSWLLAQPACRRHEWRLATTLMQTAGQGRHGRHWQSTAEQVAFSWRGWLSVETEYVGLLSLTAALAVKDALITLGVPSVQLKWPNDIYIADRKLSGMLISICQHKAGMTEIVLGIGINRHATGLPAEAISLADALDELPSIATIIAEIVTHWQTRYAMLGNAVSRRMLIDDWHKAAIWIGQSVCLTIGQEQVVGRLLGVNEQGLVRLLTDRGERCYAANEIRLRLSSTT